ncbi:adhesion G protein-coupled receptor F5 isoform 2-T3 [Anomaloglossus baeobatrachus]|uniref:adhesion G protein-coupled receptor F5-like isoform X2 n=1 Tax=Anomaloglossus baeobatrachus TaxID=238106 RepID=UPI003F4F735B
MAPGATHAQMELSSKGSICARADSRSSACADGALIQELHRRHHLKVGPRTTGIPEYTVDIEISFPDASFVSQIKDFIARNLTFPIALGVSDTEIKSIDVTTACNQTGSDVQCSCESGYLWNNTVCDAYSPCPGHNANPCDCIKSTSIPTQYCQPTLVFRNMSLRLLEPFTADFKDQTSAKYIKYKTDLDTEIVKAYKSLNGFRYGNVTDFRPGSVVADYTLVTEPASTAAITTANQNLITGLTTANYSVDPTIKTIIMDRSNIEVSPAGIFPRDNVVLICSVDVAVYTNVSWYQNKTEAIDSALYTTQVVGSSVQSTLTLSRIPPSQAGTYRCTVDNGSDSYVAETTVVVQPLDITILNTNISCNNLEVPVVQCCTQGSSVDFQMTCTVNSGKEGIVRNNTPCRTYHVAVDDATCARLKTGSYDCTCYTTNGANETRNVKVIYQPNCSPLGIGGSRESIFLNSGCQGSELTPNGSLHVGASVTSNNSVSEGKDLIMQCNCNSTSVQSITWYLANTTIPSQYYTNNLSTCQSNLTIPSTVTTVAWDGTYQCSVETGSGGIVAANKVIKVYRLVRPSQISRSPVSGSFQCKQNITFSCCLGDASGYRDPVLEILTTTGNLLQTKNMSFPPTDQCFKVFYIPSTPAECVDFDARCTLTNDNNDTVASDNMNLKYVADPTCLTPYVGRLGSVTVVSCQELDARLTGTKNFTCVKNNTGATWNLTYYGCVSVALDNIKNQLDTLTSPTSKDLVPSILGNLTSTVNTEKGTITTSANDLTLVVNLLSRVETALDKVEKPVMENFLQTVNVVVDNSTTWNQVPNRVQASSNLLQSVEKFAEKLSISGPISINNNSNIQLSGNIISNLTDYTADFDFSHTNNLTGNILINKTALQEFSANSTVISVAYSTLKDILGSPGNNSSTLGVINGLVMTTTVKGNYTNFKIGMDFKKSNHTLNNASCVFWNFKIQDWDNTGCQAKNNTDSTMVTCVCDHLTSFSILMSYDYNVSPEEELILKYISYIGLGISILSLVICIIIEATVWKSVTKNKTSYLRHVCIMNIAVTLLMADIWFIIGSAMSDYGNVDACVTATFFTHVFYLCTFFWMLTMGLILFYRLMCVFHDLSKTVMMGIAFFLGYGCPIIISVITVAVTQPSKTYTHGKACWLNMKESKAFLAFIVPALTILLVNFITLFVVIIKVLRPSVGDKPKKEEKSSLNHIAKCILILTPLLGLTWGFGIGVMISGTVVIRGIFSALNALQGLFILLFGCLMDKKVRDALLSRFSVSRWSSQQTKTSNLRSSDPVFSKGVINLFAKRGVYNISSAQASSSSEMSNSYSLLT